MLPSSRLGLHARSSRASGESEIGDPSAAQLSGLGFRVWGLGFRVQGLGCRV